MIGNRGRAPSETKAANVREVGRRIDRSRRKMTPEGHKGRGVSLEAGFRKGSRGKYGFNTKTGSSREHDKTTGNKRSKIPNLKARP